jgi:hypothetical protein
MSPVNLSSGGGRTVSAWNVINNMAVGQSTAARKSVMPES